MKISSEMQGNMISMRISQMIAKIPRTLILDPRGDLIVAEGTRGHSRAHQSEDGHIRLEDGIVVLDRVHHTIGNIGMTRHVLAGEEILLDEWNGPILARCRLHGAIEINQHLLGDIAKDHLLLENTVIGHPLLGDIGVYPPLAEIIGQDTLVLVRDPLEGIIEATRTRDRAHRGGTLNYLDPHVTLVPDRPIVSDLHEDARYLLPATKLSLPCPLLPSGNARHLARLRLLLTTQLLSLALPHRALPPLHNLRPSVTVSSSLSSRPPLPI
jgi:hypothetical protein